MLCVIVLLSLATLVLGLSPSALEVSVKAAASTVASVDDIVIGVVVYNPTDQDIRFIARSNILDTSATRSFNVSNVNGELVRFAGVMALYDLSASGIYMTIPAGGYVTVNHTNIGALYDFESSGTGTFTFEPIARFQANSDAPPEVVDVPPVKVEITQDVKRRYPYQSFPGCSDASKFKVLQDLGNEATSWGNYVTNHLPSTPPLEMPYFSGGRLDVMAYFFEVVQVLHEVLIYMAKCGPDPAGICGGSGGVISYSILGYGLPSATFNGDTYLCDTFFTSVGFLNCSNIGATNSSQIGVILHELRNILAMDFLDIYSLDTMDIAYGCSAVNSLSAEDQYNNPDNYRCLALAAQCGYWDYRQLDEL